MSKVDDVRKALFELERVFLDGLMLNEEAIRYALNHLPATSITDGAHREIYHAILALYTRGSTVDAVTVVAQMERAGTALRAGEEVLALGDEFGKVDTKRPLKEMIWAMASWIHTTADLILPIVAKAHGEPA